MIVIVDTGGANLCSIENALKRLNKEYIISSKKSDIQRASKLILPGVGNIDRIMQGIHKNDLYEALKETKKPLLGICIGMQILFESSQEGNACGLGLLKGKVVRIKTDDLPIPHMGWNRVYFDKDTPLTRGLKSGEYFYFVHSFMAEENEHTIASTHYAASMPAIVNRDNFFGMQFHPEKSSKSGLTILRNFLEL